MFIYFVIMGMLFFKSGWTTDPYQERNMTEAMHCEIFWQTAASDKIIVDVM